MTQRSGKYATIALFLLPALLLYSAFVIWPMLRAVSYSLYRWNGLGPATNFVGPENFVRILDDPVFRGALWHNAQIVLLSMLIQIPLALGLALLMNTRIRGRTAFRTIFFLPFVLSEVITGLVWNFIFYPNGGLFNTFIGLFGVKPTALLGELDSVMYALFAVITWKYFGYHMVLFLTGLQNIPAELNEAARVDGASDGQILRHITMPLLRPTARLVIYLSVIGSLQIFDLVWAMTQGGPVSASETMATYLYRFGFQRFQLGYGSAVSLIMFGLCFTFSLLYQRFVMRRDFQSQL